MNRPDRDSGFDSSWILPIVMTFAFWPVGIFMLFKKYKETRAQANRNKNYAPLISSGGLLTLIGFLATRATGSEIGAFMFLGGLALLTSSIAGNRKYNRLYRTYWNIIGDQPYISIAELAKITGRSRKKVKKDLQKMLDNNLLPEDAYIDHAANCLILQPGYVRGTARPQPDPMDNEPIIAEVVDEPKAKKKPADQPQPEPQQQDPADREAAILQETFDAKLREIRYWNDEIDDERVSARIDDIEATTANIFYLVREKPERASEIRTFMNYYLPTTLKLLKAYARLEKQSVAGENIKSSRQEIERILDKLAEGFRQQLDRLFQADAIDISSDIDVLETMMAKDGLLNEMKIR